jgi:hypothetical protein
MRGLSSGRRTRWDVVVVVALVAVGIGLRAPGLGPSSLWIDDAWVAFAHRAGYGDLTEIGLSAPGFSLLLKIWFEIVGFTEVSAQVVPFAAAIVAPPLAYVILRYRVGAAVALAGASWLLLAPVHVEYSTRVKQYSTEVVLALLLVHLSWRLVDEPTERRTWRRLALLSTVAVLISFPLASVAGAGCLVAAFVGLRRTGKLDTMLLWLVVPTLTTAAWFVIVIRHRQYPGLQAFWEPHYIQTDAGIRIAVESALDRAREFLEQTSPLPVVPSAIIVALGFVLVLHRRPPLFVVTALPLAAAVTLAALDRAPLGGGRTDLYLLAGTVIAVAVGIDHGVTLTMTAAPDPRLVMAVVASLALIGAVTAFARHDVPSYPQEDIRPLVNELQDRRRPGDAVLVYHAGKWAFATYADVGVTVRPVSAPYDVVFDDPLIVRQINPSTERRLERSINQADAAGDRLWLIGSHFSTSWERTLAALGAAGLVVVETWERPGAALVLLE